MMITVQNILGIVFYITVILIVWSKLYQFFLILSKVNIPSKNDFVKKFHNLNFPVCGNSTANGMAYSISVQDTPHITHPQGKYLPAVILHGY